MGRTPVDYESLHITASASIGFVSLPLAPHGLRLPWERAIDLVDTVMYLAKVHGRNRAYGLERMLATDPLQAAGELAARLEGAWQAGDVTWSRWRGPSSAARPVRRRRSPSTPRRTAMRWRSDRLIALTGARWLRCWYCWR